MQLEQGLHVLQQKCALELLEDVDCTDSSIIKFP
jgi:hypothetical protein